MTKILLSMFVAVWCAGGCGKGGANKDSHADLQNIWWKLTGGSKSTKSDFRLGSDGTYEDSAGQKGTYSWDGDTLTINVGTGPGDHWDTKLVSGSPTELKLEFMSKVEIYTPRK